jgi:hypothetical protein
MGGVYLSDAHMQSLRQHIAAGEEPWKSAFAEMEAEAGAAMEQLPLSVRDDSGSPYYRADAGYVAGQDGVRDQGSNRNSHERAVALSQACMSLALRWRLGDDSRHADKALDLIHAWCINQSTRMLPTGRVFDSATPGNRYGGDVGVFGGFGDLFLAAYLLRDYPGWDLLAHAAVKRWVREMIEPQRSVMFYNGREMCNNWESARLCYLAKGALLLDDLDLLAEVFERWRHILPLKMTDEGELPAETERTRSMNYTLFDLRSMLDLAEIGRALNQELYDYEVNGKGIRKAVDYAAHYLLHIDQWPHKMIKPVSEEPLERHMAAFELAYRQWGDLRYLEIIAAYGGRPVTSCFGTLLFGRS